MDGNSVIAVSTQVHAPFFSKASNTVTPPNGVGLLGLLLCKHSTVLEEHPLDLDTPLHHFPFCFCTPHGGSTGKSEQLRAYESNQCL